MRHWRGPFDRQGYHHGNLKEALIEAAQRFIAERGIGGFTLADAAKLVGVTPAALYRHFRGREALVAEVAFRGFDELAKRLGRALQSDGTALERFTRMGEAYLAFAEQDRKSTRLNSSHANISYAVFCLKKKKNKQNYCLPIPCEKGL